MTTQQKAVFVTEVGKPLELGKREIPQPGEHQVLIRVSACMSEYHNRRLPLTILTTLVLPHDTYCRDWGLYVADKLPFILGANLAGTITALGSNVANFRTGDRVFGLANIHLDVPDQQGLQQYAVLDADAIASTPAGFTDEAVATLPTNLITSWIALFTKEGFAFPPPLAGEGKSFDYAAQHVVILGGGTNVGRFAVQLAALAGVGTIITVAGASNREALIKIGATHTLDRHLGVDELTAKIRSIVGEAGVEHIYDCANMEFTLACALVSTGSSKTKTKLRTLLPLDAFSRSDYPRCDAEMLDARNDQLHPHQSTFWASVTKWLEEGRVLPTNFRVVEGLDDVAGINAGLDGYGEFGRSGVNGVVVKI